MPRKLQLMCLSLFLGLLSLATQPGFAQNPPPLNFGNNFFVTGDYIVAGAYNMTQKFETRNNVSYAVGTISVPDNQNLGITGTKQVPPGAQVVAALLYWQTVEKVGITAGGPGTGQNGYIRPLVTGGPAAPGYLISGTNVTGVKTVSWSAGGCGGTSTGKQLLTYRADVAGALPVDANGNSIANGNFEVRLPSIGNSTPITLGATLVVIYRIPSGANGPTIPLNSIVIYDGDYAQGNAQLTMTQQLQGFYDPDQNVSRLTHIVGSGQSNKFQTVYLGSGTHSLLPLPTLYVIRGNKLPPFPGWYGTWDNPTWTFTNANATTNPGVLAGDSNATTKVVPSMSNQGCVSWGAVIVSTTVKNSDGDGILDSWKLSNPPGYCDAAFNNGVCNIGSLLDPRWVDLPGAHTGQKDIFLQYDYMCTTVNGPPQDPNHVNAKDNSCTIGGNDYSFDPRQAEDQLDGSSPHTNAVQKVVAAFNNHPGNPKPFVLHANPGNAIQETQLNISCTASDATCPFPNEPGTVGFREGLAYIKNQTIDRQTGLLGCDPNTNANCFAVFPHGKKDSYHYALFSHGVGLPNWFLSDGSISSVGQSGNTVTFTTSSPHGIQPILGDTLCSSPNLGRVTVVFAITNQNLNGTYCAKQANPPAANKFAITVPGSPTTTPYTLKTDPNLAVANGQVTSMSGYSDVGGQNSVISLGYGNWGPPNNPASDGNKWQMKAGTFMHELGHTLGLTHGGAFYNNLPNNPNDYTANYETNCKPNVQSVMSYLFQFDLLQLPNQFYSNGRPVKVVDFSEEALTTLTETSPHPSPGFLSPTVYANTAWFQLTPAGSNNSVSPHCDGTPRLPGELPVTYVPGSPADLFWTSASGEDINFNGKSTDVMHGHDEWDGTPAQSGAGPAPGLDLQQVSAVGTISTIGPGGEQGGLKPAGGGGGLKPAGGGGGLHPAGGGGGLHPAGGGGGLKPAGGGGLSAEITHEAANSYARPPESLSITQEETSPRLIDLSWFAPLFGQGVQYNVYRSDAGGPFNLLTPGPGTQTTFRDTVTCNPSGYRYRVTAVVNNDQSQPQESVPSNIVPAAGQAKLTGCYTVSAVTYPNGASGFQGTIVPITWTLTDDFYITPGTGWANAAANTTNPVTNLAASTLVANGPRPGNCTASGTTTILLKGVPTAQSGASTFVLTNPQTGQFTFNWDTDVFCAGSYTFTLTLDSTQPQASASALQLGIDINDQDTPRIDTLSLPDATVGVAYSTILTEHGGVNDGTTAFTWTIVPNSVMPGNGSTLPGLSFQQNTAPATNGTLSGTPCVPGSYTFTVKVMDSVGNSGTQTFTLLVLAAPVAQVNQPLVPESSVPGAAGFTLTLNGTGFDTCSAVQWNGSAVATTFQSATQLTAAIPSSDVATSGTAFISVTKTGSPSSNVDFFQITNPTAVVFLGRADIATGLRPIGLIAGDFNADGKVDVAIANSGDNTVSILAGNGDGTFIVKPVLLTGSLPYSLIAGDFNNDGKLDLAVTNFASGASSTVSIFIGNGDGTFQPAVSYTVGSGPFSVVTGDFNRDGRLDLAVTNQNDHSVSILLGNGDGTFQTHVDYPAGTTDVAAVAMGDFNGDGKLDLALTNPSSDTVSVLLGNGDGTFQAAVPYATGNLGDHPIAVSAADFNGDGKLDLAVTNLDAKTVAILLGIGDGTFQPKVTYPTTNGSSIGPSAMTTGDFNGDGKVDLAITEQGNNTVSILLGNGNGSFQNPLEFSTGNLAAGVAAGDFNGDGRLDLTVANYMDNTVSVMLQLPQPPTNLVTTNVTSSQVTLGWTASTTTGVTGYNVYRSTTSGGSYTKLNSTLVAGSGYTDTPVTPGTTYYYVVTAVDAGGLESVNSNEVSATP